MGRRDDAVAALLTDALSADVISFVGWDDDRDANVTRAVFIVTGDSKINSLALCLRQSNISTDCLAERKGLSERTI